MRAGSEYDYGFDVDQRSPRSVPSLTLHNLLAVKANPGKNRNDPRMETDYRRTITNASWYLASLIHHNIHRVFTATKIADLFGGKLTINMEHGCFQHWRNIQPPSKDTRA